MTLVKESKKFSNDPAIHDFRLRDVLRWALLFVIVLPVLEVGVVSSRYFGLGNTPPAKSDIYFRDMWVVAIATFAFFLIAGIVGWYQARANEALNERLDRNLEKDQ